MWLVVDRAGHVLSPEPVDAPVDDAARYSVLVPPGWPDALAWSPAARGFVKVPSPAEQLADLRAERDRRLMACDWTQLADAPLDDGERAAWQTYRRALRDLPASGAEWPEEPV